MAETPAPDKPSWRRRHLGMLVLLFVLVVPPAIFVGWAWTTLHYTYSAGDRAGYVQKLSQKGWLCKTWEGELAMATLPGVMPQIFQFSVRNDSIAHILENSLGKRVSLHYEQHPGVPTSCFGETEYYVTNMRVVEP